MRYTYFRYLFMACILLWGSKGYTQDLEGFEYKAFQSPEAYSLGKFGETPVSLYTGVPNISVPITQISAGSFNLPISLDYHSSGIKAEEKASWVGLGWALSAGGVITRSSRGNADDDEDNWGYIYEGWDILDDHPIMDQTTDLVGSTSDPDKQAIYQAIYDLTEDHLDRERDFATYDTEPDVFFFNFAGRSGQFVLPTDMLDNGAINPKAEIRTIPHSNLKITIDEIEAGGINEIDAGIKSWSITDEQGVQYFFEADEIHETTVSSPHEINLFNSKWIGDKTSWFLTKIVLPGSSEEIHLHYSDYEEVVYYSRSSKIRFGFDEESRTGIYNVLSRHKVRRLKFIESNSHVIHFETAANPDRYDAPRQTMYGVPYYSDYEDPTEFADNLTLTKQEYKLHSIKLYKKTGSSDSVEIKRWNFNTGYFNNSASYEIEHTATIGEPDLFKRLKLNSIDVADANDNVLHTYSFDYNEPNFQYGYYDPNADQMVYPSGVDRVDVTLPPYLDIVKRNSQEEERAYFYYLGPFDHWGYFNGAFDNNVYNITDHNIPYADIDYTDISFEPGPNSVDRQPNEATMKAGTLSRITYPTGGYTDFTYEINQYDAVGWKQHTEQDAGGLRIKKIESYSDPDSDPVIKTYSYTESGGTESSGVLVNEPVYMDQFYTDYHTVNDSPEEVTSYGYSSSSLISLGTTLGGIVGYKEVTVGYGENNEFGYEISRFSSPESEENSDTLYTAFFVNEDNYHSGGKTAVEWDTELREDAFTTYDTQDLYTDHFSRMKWGFGYRSVMDSRRGKLLSKEIYNFDKELLQKTTYGYENTMDTETEDSDSHVRIKGLSATNLEVDRLGSLLAFPPTYVIIYEHISSSHYLVADTTFIYQPGSLSNPMMTVNRYEYYNDSNYLQTTEKVERNSNNDERVTQYKYAHEIYDSQDEMEDKNMLSQIYSITVRDGSDNVKSKNWTLWKDWGSGKWLPCGKWAWDGGSLSPSLTCNSN